MSNGKTVVTTEDRVAALEAAFEEVKLAKGIRGPAGPIHAAVANAEKAATEIATAAEERIQNNSDAQLTTLLNEVGRIRADFEAHKTALKQIINDCVAISVIALLQEYHVLNEACAPSSLYFQHEIEALIQKTLAEYGLAKK